MVFQELFSSTSPNKVYSRAFDKVKSHPEVRSSCSGQIPSPVIVYHFEMAANHCVFQNKSICFLFLKCLLNGRLLGHLENQLNATVRPPAEGGGSKSGTSTKKKKKNPVQCILSHSTFSYLQNAAFSLIKQQFFLKCWIENNKSDQSWHNKCLLLGFKGGSCRITTFYVCS